MKTCVIGKRLKKIENFKENVYRFILSDNINEYKSNIKNLKDLI